MHEDFLSYIMTGLSRGLTPPQPQLQRFDDEERIIRALAAQEAASRKPATTPTPAPRKGADGPWHHRAKRVLQAIGLMSLSNGPSACR
jgi:hypothetical protein